MLAFYFINISLYKSNKNYIYIYIYIYIIIYVIDLIDFVRNYYKPPFDKRKLSRTAIVRGILIIIISAFL